MARLGLRLVAAIGIVLGSAWIASAADYTNDTRSGIVDGPSTMVVDGRMLKVLAWYDNEYGYAFRMADLAARVAATL